VALAACLVSRPPDVLLLDEPEAHLDVARRRIVEELVQDFEGAVLIVSHDRHLLDETVTQIAELEGGRIRMWQGGYSATRVARELELVAPAAVRDPAEGDRPPRGGDPPLRGLGPRVVDKRHIMRARNKQRQIDADGEGRAPGLRAAQDGARAAQRARGGDRVIALRADRTSPPSCASRP
jgi:ATP-binding cassette subfamily F protein 3